MIGHGKRQAHQLQHRFQQAFGLAQPQAKHQAQRQGGLDCQIGLVTRSLEFWPTNRTISEHFELRQGCERQQYG